MDSELVLFIEERAKFLIHHYQLYSVTEKDLEIILANAFKDNC